MDYRELYNQYWQRDDRRGEHSFQSVLGVADEIIACVGVGSVLDVGCGNGHLVRRLNTLGCQAEGVDVSDVAVEVANAASPGLFSVADIKHLPFEDNSFDCVVSTDCFEHLEEQDVPAALAELRRVSRGSVYLRIALTEDRDSKWHLTIQNREWWETRCFEAGFRKHPRYFLASPFGALDSQLDNCAILLEKIPNDANRRFPLEQLLEERQLHTDMSREAGRRSDAHNMRYAEAARAIRPGDRVLDVACGLGYGSTIMTHNSRCASYLGIDNSAFAINYARASFEDQAGAVRFQQGSLPECLEQFPDASFDFIASFETLEHLQQNTRFLDECRRVLTPAGRLCISVPNDWTEEDGLDPNPHHFHVYDWPRLLEQLDQAGFATEKTMAETVSRRKEAGAWADHGYEWQNHPVEQADQHPSEWCVALVMKSPFDNHQAASYENPGFPEAAGADPSHVMGFATQYDNPWLVPCIISRGLRTERAALRESLAEQVLLQPAGKGADRAAAACVQAYALLDREAAWAEVEAVLAAAEPHLTHRNWEAARPIDVRWAVSLRYASALLCLHGGRRDDAKHHLEECAALPFLRYSPLLATKSVGAAVLRATLAMADRDPAAIETWLARGLALAEQAICTDWRASLGDPAHQPLPAFREMAEVMELAAQCSAGLSLLRVGGPGVVFCEQFRASKTADIRRLTDENARLVEELGRKSDAVAWHQEQLRIWYDAAHFWMDQSKHHEQRANALDPASPGAPRPKGPFGKLGRSVSKRVNKLRGKLKAAMF
ncbi:putative S-adenosylmethionine-dependent methyltransferase/MSMEI_2290 [Posidoniimonas corsicana]|uniref:Putative S-adenosylmethionine-dependent methyltransferase/MSMEI_2290 n=1 Tax=Posidoniimonas corsicana TaxID=1938618 RepID=A0A5C5V1M5_9BACT|nr:class I SAM-dependent methyltransferase [Posidoniimonas corsicana]TWT32291.1 putative S-adenosylmethionine-dependent methyltransferase/MSMEI_2290 [Posidoniimonas corsicana]